jgi:hypothetical protein
MIAGAMRPELQLPIPLPRLPQRLIPSDEHFRAAGVSLPGRPCPQSDQHQRTRIYRSKGRVVLCRCDDCGHVWQETIERPTGPPPF